MRDSELVDGEGGKEPEQDAVGAKISTEWPGDKNAESQQESLR